MGQYQNHVFHLENLFAYCANLYFTFNDLEWSLKTEREDFPRIQSGHYDQ